MTNPLNRAIFGVLALMLAVGPMAASPAAANCGGQTNCADELRRAEQERQERSGPAAPAPSNPIADALAVTAIVVIGSLLFAHSFKDEKDPAAPSR